MKRIIIFIIFLIFILTIISLDTSNDNYLVLESDLLTKQELVDEEIKEYMNDKSYTIDNPKIINNPYFISPLTSLIIFNSNKSINIKVNINNQEYKAFNGSSFCLPIIYLRDDYNNKIDIINGNKTYTYYIKTPKIKDVNINIEGNLNNNILLSSSKLKHSIIDGEGNLIWYLNLDSQGFIESISETSFLIGVEETEMYDNTSVFSGIYEIDYLGKIIKRFDTPYKYHHAIKYIGNNQAFILGTNKQIPMNIIYRLDLSNGHIIDYLNIYELLIDKNSQIKDYLDNLDLGLGTNSIDYLNDDIIISLRNINTVISINYKTKDINYIISSDKKVQKYFKSYLIEFDDKILGAHDVKFISDDKVSLYNNGYDYSNNYKSGNATSYVIKINNNKANIINSFTYEDKYSYAYGSFEYNDETSLVNYPYMYKKETDDPIKDIEKFYTNIILYKDNKINTKIKINDNIYKAKIFNSFKVSNYVITDYQYFNESISTEKYKISNFKNISNVLKFTNNSVETLIDNETFSTLTIILKGKKQYNIKYLGTKTYFQVDKGKYSVYLKMDDNYYKLKEMVNFK